MVRLRLHLCIWVGLGDRARDWKLGKAKYTTYRGEATRRTPSGSAFPGGFGATGLRSQPLASQVGSRPGMRMAPRKKRSAHGRLGERTAGAGAGEFALASGEAG